ncbi:MAG: gamma-glutamyl-gamma-aminobutyrate hydrolase family protein, partial [Lachnospiraceae bacterium]|nr:gamma-glutamyl-gamma-aminobutyrate hydrolase family protein [Candidatus Hippenecus merdae]
MRIAIPEFKAQPNYYKALEDLGAEGIMVTDATAVDPKEFDGLLIPGGVDIHPSIFGEEVNGSREIRPVLDYLQFTVLDKFVKARKPVMGICRGHQVIAAYFGCRLYQDIGEAGN